MTVLHFVPSFYDVKCSNEQKAPTQCTYSNCKGLLHPNWPAYVLVLPPRMFQQCEEPRFTIQQIDLLQRLRRTGITAGEVVHALDTLDHLEQKHEHKLSRKPSYRPPSSSSVLVSSSMMSTATQTSFPDTHLSLSPTNNFDTTFPPLQISVASPVPAAAVAENGLPAAANGKLSPPRFPLGVVGGAVMAPGFGFDTGEEDIDVEEKVEELMR